MNMYNLLLGGDDILLGKTASDSRMLIFIVCSFISVPTFYFGANASCVSSFECSKIESADHTYFSSFSSIFCFCSSSVRQLFLYIAFLLENVVCWIKFSIKIVIQWVTWKLREMSALPRYRLGEPFAFITRFYGAVSPSNSSIADVQF